MSSNKYQSLRGGGDITAAQFIMEQFLILLARQKHSQLPEKFWQLDEYKKLWKRHVRSIHKRLKDYDVEAIIKALNDPKLKKLRSLSDKASWLWKPVFDKYQKIVTAQKLVHQNNTNTNDKVDPLSYRKPITTKSNMCKLKELDERL